MQEVEIGRVQLHTARGLNGLNLVEARRCPLHGGSGGRVEARQLDRLRSCLTSAERY